MAMSIVVKEQLANKTVNYDTEIKTYQFEPGTQVIKKGNPNERTNLTRVFEEGFGNQIRRNCQRYIPKSTEKKLALPKSPPQ